MKIRNGYVSNSSSSSFLVACKKVESFDKFNRFVGYNTFIKDFNEKNNNVLGLIVSFIQNEMYCYFENMTNRARGEEPDIDLFMRNSQWYDLCQFFSYQESELRNCIDEIREIGEDFIEKMKDNPNWNWCDKEYCDFHEKYNKIEMKAKEIAEKFLASDNVKGWIIKNLGYADETAEGSFMEHQFMPFMMHCPENDMIVIGQSNH